MARGRKGARGQKRHSVMSRHPGGARLGPVYTQQGCSTDRRRGRGELAAERSDPNSPSREEAVGRDAVRSERVAGGAKARRGRRLTVGGRWDGRGSHEAHEAGPLLAFQQGSRDVVEGLREHVGPVRRGDRESQTFVRGGGAGGFAPADFRGDRARRAAEAGSLIPGPAADQRADMNSSAHELGARGQELLVARGQSRTDSPPNEKRSRAQGSDRRRFRADARSAPRTHPSRTTSASPG